MGTRARTYALLMAGTLAGGLLGAAFAQVTVTISPAYFVMGKGLSVPPADLRLAAGGMGLRGGLALGAVVVGIGLWTEARGVALRWRRLILGTAASALGAALLLGALMNLVDPFGVRLGSAGVLDEAEAGRYLAVWGAHIGAYFGAAAAVILLATRGKWARAGSDSSPP